MIKKHILTFFTIVSFLCCIFTLPSCTQKNGVTEPETSSGGYPYTFTDDAGNTVTLKSKPQNAAILFSSFADIFVTAGGKVNISVGETVERGFADESCILVDKGSGHSALDLETLIASKPDFVVGTLDYDGQCDAVALTSQSGIPSALFKVESFEDYLRVLKIFTDITGIERNYTLYGTDIQSRIDELIKLADERSSDSEAPTMLFIRAGSAAKSTKAKTGKEHFACAMLERLGCENIAYGAPVLLDGLSLEEIVVQNPEHIFVVPMGDESSAKEYVNTLFTQVGWSSLSAVKENRVTFLPKDLFHFKPNKNWANAYEYLTNLLYGIKL